MCDHNHGSNACCAHEAGDIVAAEEGTRYDMHAYIDHEKVTTLNEVSEDSGKMVFRPWDDRMNKELFVESDADEELLFNIPFTGHVKITGIVIIGDGDDTNPAKIRLFKDRPSMSFDDCALQPEQEIDLKQDTNGSVDYALKASKFGTLTHLSIHVSSNFGADSTKINFIGLRGEFQHDIKEQVVIATYESRPIPKDHKGEIPDAVMRDLM